MWDQIYENVCGIAEKKGPFECLFRGHGDTRWDLIPSIGRNAAYAHVESIVYFDFVTMAGALLPENASPWSVALAMQHHGLPTRLLDWTDNFAVALHFALRHRTTETPCVWVLDPFALNDSMGWGKSLPNLVDLGADYSKFFIEASKSLDEKVIAVAPNRHHPRAFSQRSFFTVHNDIATPMDKLAPKALEKIEIPESAIPGAKQFLALAGVNEYSLFPDLDGLARELRKMHCS